MATKTHTGWKNYETWAVSLWLDNDEGSSDYLMDLANDENKSTYAKAAELQEEITDMMPDLGASLYSDLLTYGLQAVDWQEIIKAHDERKYCPVCGEVME